MRKAFRERRVFHHVRSDSLMIVHLVDRSRADKASVDGGATGSGFGGNKSEAAAPVIALRPAEPRKVVPGYGHFGGSPIPMREIWSCHSSDASFGRAIFLRVQRHDNS